MSGVTVRMCFPNATIQNISNAKRAINTSNCAPSSGVRLADACSTATLIAGRYDFATFGADMSFCSLKRSTWKENESVTIQIPTITETARTFFPFLSLNHKFLNGSISAEFMVIIKRPRLGSGAAWVLALLRNNKHRELETRNQWLHLIANIPA